MPTTIEPLAQVLAPRTARFFSALPISPLMLGLITAAILLALFISGRVVWDAGVHASDLRLTLIHILMAAYAVFAYAFYVQNTQSITTQLEASITPSQEWRQRQANLTTRYRLLTVLSVVVGVIIYIWATEVTTADREPWDWANTNYDTRWMRVLGPMFSFSIAGLLAIVILESHRLGRLSQSVEKVDLFDLRPYQPLIRLGLTNALLVVGMASVQLLFLMEPGFLGVMGQLALFFAVIAWIGLIMPLRGIRSKINQAKERELEWCRDALQKATTQLKAGQACNPPMGEISHYKDEIESIRNWPFDNPTLIRFALYLLIPLASMFGGAIVERALEVFVF